MSLTSDTALTMPVVPAGMTGYGGSGNSGNGMWGGDGAWWIIILFLFVFCGWGNGNWGGNNAGASGGATPYFVGTSTQADVQRGFDQQAVITKLDGITQGICSLGYDQLNQMNGINSNISQTGFGIQQAIQAGTVANMQGTNAIQSQIASCCCDAQRAIDGVNYNMATNTCAITNAITGAANQITQNDNANYQRIMDKFCQLELAAKDEKIADLQGLVNSLNLAQSQTNQNAYLVQQLGPKYPVPAFLTCNPYTGQSYTNGFTYGAGCGCNACA